MPAPSQVGIEKPHPVTPTTPFSSKWANSVARSIDALHGRGDDKSPMPLSPRIVSAFWPKFYWRDDSVYFTLSPGSIIERHTITGEALQYWPITSIDSGTGKEIEYGPIADGYSVYVHYDTKPIGSVGTGSPYVDPEIIIATAPASTHYAPPIEGDSGSSGTQYVKLCTLHINSETKCLSVDKVAMGDNVNHWRDLPKFKATGYTSGVHALFTRFSLTDGAFHYKGLKATGDVTLTESGGAGSEIIEIGTTSATGPSFNIEISYGGYPASIFLYVRNGRFVSVDDGAAVPTHVVVGA